MDIDTTTLGLRDRAMLLVGFGGGFRRSELVGLAVESLDITPDGIWAHLLTSKNDQEGKGTARLIRRDSTAFDPAAALAAWLEHADIESGAVFRSVDRHGNIADAAMTGRAVAMVMKRRATDAGLDAENISGHSLRRGAATTARNNGADPLTIARGLGWADGSAVLNRYFETSIEDAPNLGL